MCVRLSRYMCIIIIDSFRYGDCYVYIHTHTPPARTPPWLAGLYGTTTTEECILYSIIFDRNIYFHLAFAVRAQTNGNSAQGISTYRTVPFTARSALTLRSTNILSFLFVPPTWSGGECLRWECMSLAASEPNVTVINVCAPLPIRVEIESWANHTKTRIWRPSIGCAVQMSYSAHSESLNDDFWEISRGRTWFRKWYFLFLPAIFRRRFPDGLCDGTLERCEYGVHSMGHERNEKSQNEFYARRFAASNWRPNVNAAFFCDGVCVCDCI